MRRINKSCLRARALFVRLHSHIRARQTGVAVRSVVVCADLAYLAIAVRGSLCRAGNGSSRDWFYDSVRSRRLSGVLASCRCHRLFPLLLELAQVLQGVARTAQIPVHDLLADVELVLAEREVDIALVARDVLGYGGAQVALARAGGDHREAAVLVLRPRQAIAEACCATGILRRCCLCVFYDLVCAGRIRSCAAVLWTGL